MDILAYIAAKNAGASGGSAGDGSASELYDGALNLTEEQKTQAKENLGVANTLSYNAETGALDLKSGDTVLSSVIIEAGGALTLGYDQTTGRLSLLKDGTEISYVILSGLPVTITRDGDTLRVNNVPAVSSITQTDGTLALT